MNYQQKLKDPRWLDIRREVLQRDDFTCQSCGDKERVLQVHHKYYEAGKEPWSYPLTALITLCSSCHECEENGRVQAFKDLNKAIADAGFTREDVEKLSQAFKSVKVLPIYSYMVMAKIFRAVLDSHSNFNKPFTKGTDADQRQVIFNHYCIKEDIYV